MIVKSQQNRIELVTRPWHHQRPSHIFIASLAAADLLLGLTVMVPRLSNEILDGWYFGYFLCQVYSLLVFNLPLE